MDIGICLDRQDFMYDVHSLVKSFFPDDEVSIFTEQDEEKCALPRNLLLKIRIPEYTERKAAKDSLKRELYGMLSSYTGRSLPWGTLSGIRPTKIPMAMLGQGRGREEIEAFLGREYLVAPARARLATDVALREREVLAGRLTGSAGYSLYFHIPFCPSICLYCTFSSSPIGAWKSRSDEYLAAMLREMGRRRERILELHGGRAPDTVYIGGGTPTALTEGQLTVLLSAVTEAWDTGAVREFTVEAGRPDSLTKEKLDVLRRFGVSRISVNPQSMNAETLVRIGRGHTPEDVVRAFLAARESGFDNINMDIILGLPGEGRAQVERTLEEIRKLGPDSLTVHSLAVKRASRLRQTIRENREADRDADHGTYCGLVFENSEELMDLAADTASAMGMAPYYLYRQKNMRGNLENTGFARPGAECLYNILIMEELQSIYAFGAGASTKYVLPGGRIERVVSPKDVTTYLKRQNCPCPEDPGRKAYGTDS